MKKILEISSLIFCILMTGCSKEVDIDLNVKNAESYSMLYMS
jgi:hypothetical protein